MDKQKLIAKIDVGVINALNWIESQMFTFNRASGGAYERIRINTNERVTRTRTDTSSELLRTIFDFRNEYFSNKYDDVYENQIKWLLRVQNKDKNAGGFPFALADGQSQDWIAPDLFQNDNGKILINFLDVYDKTKDERLYSMAKKLADFWVGVQDDNGLYDNGKIEELQKFPKAPCFVMWMMAAMYHAGVTFNDDKYTKSGNKAFEYLKTTIKDGRMLTTYEITDGGTENWRAVSSENVIAIYTLSYSYKYHKNQEFKDYVDLLSKFVDTLIDKDTGAVINGTQDLKHTSQNNDINLADLVYTDNFAISSFLEAYEVFGDRSALDKAIKLADWLLDIQCKGESYLWDGGWRGAYNLKTKKWDGRCDQNNAMLDEGGEFSVYVGWTTLPIVFALIRLRKILRVLND